MASKAIGFLNFKFGADLGGFDRAMKKAQKNLKKFGKDLQKTGKTLTTNLTLPILAFGAASLKAFDEQQKAIAQVEAGLLSTGNAAGFTSEQLQKMAADLQKTSLFGDEEIMKNATAQLLTFTNITGEQFAKTQEIALDLATRLDGDLKSASIMLGKALNDPLANLSALSRAGIQFSEDQKEVIEKLIVTGNLAEAQTIILEELERQYGGSAKAARDAGLGGVEALKNKFSDLTEQIGERLVPIVTKLAEFLVGLLEKFDKLDEGTKDTIVTFGLVLAAIGPILIFVGRLSVGLAAASKAFGALNLVMRANPIGIVITILGTLIGVLVYFYNTNIKVRASIKGLFAAAKVYFKGMADLILKKIAGIGNNIIGVFTVDIDRIKDGFNKSKDAIVKYGSDIGTAFTDAFEDTIAKGIGDAASNVQKELKVDSSLLGDDGDGDGGSDFSDLIKDEKTKALQITRISPKLVLPPATAQYSIAEAYFIPESIFEKIDRLIGKTKELGQWGTWSGDLWKATMQKIGAELAGGAKSMEEYGKTVKGVITDSIKGLIAKGVTAAVSNAMESMAPFPGSSFLIPVIAGAAAGLATTAFGSLIPEFAKGGLVTGPTLGLIGEGVGTTASNPEVVAPLDKLKQFMGGGSQNVVVEGVIKGNDIFLSNRNTGYNRQRSV